MILPFVVLRRLDMVLEPKKDAPCRDEFFAGAARAVSRLCKYCLKSFGHGGEVITALKCRNVKFIWKTVLFFYRKLIIIIGILIPLCTGQSLCVFCITKDFINLLVSAITKQDANSNWKPNLVSNIYHNPI